MKIIFTKTKKEIKKNDNYRCHHDNDNKENTKILNIDLCQNKEKNNRINNNNKKELVFDLYHVEEAINTYK